MDTFSKLEMVLLILAVFTGAVQLFLLLGMALKGVRVTVWWGVLCAACLIAMVLL